jgi:hypothetical protein
MAEFFPTDALSVAQMDLPLESWRALALALLRWAEKKQPAITGAIIPLIAAHGRGLHMLPVVQKHLPHLPGLSLDFIKKFERDLEALDFGRGKIKADLAIPRRSLWLAHRILTKAIKGVQADLRNGGTDAAIRGLWGLFGPLIWQELARLPAPETLRAQTKKRPEAVWRVLLQLFCCTFATPAPAKPKLDSIVAQCTPEARPAEASLVVLSTLCNKTPEHIRGEISAYAPKRLPRA